MLDACHYVNPLHHNSPLLRRPRPTSILHTIRRQHPLRIPNAPRKIPHRPIRPDDLGRKINPKHPADGIHDAARVLALALKGGAKVLVDGARRDVRVAVEAVLHDGEEGGGDGGLLGFGEGEGLVDGGGGTAAGACLLLLVFGEAGDLDFKGERDGHDVVAAVVVVAELEGAGGPPVFG